VQALRQAAPVDISDTATVMMRFAGGATGSLTAVGITPTFHRLHIFGTEGWVEIRQNSRFEYCPVAGERTVIEFPAADLLRRQLEAFAAAASGEAPYPVTPDQAVAGVAVLEAMGKSAISGQVVRVGK
jgi:predicted dehydrogenase